MPANSGGACYSKNVAGAARQASAHGSWVPQLAGIRMRGGLRGGLPGGLELRNKLASCEKASPTRLSRASTNRSTRSSSARSRVGDPGSVPPSATPQSWRAAGGSGSAEARADADAMACLLDGSGGEGGEGGEGEEGGSADEDKEEGEQEEEGEVIAAAAAAAAAAAVAHRPSLP